MSLAKRWILLGAALGAMALAGLPGQTEALSLTRPPGRLPALLLGHKDERPTARLRIEVIAGNASQPVAEASVYVKFDEDPNAKKSKQLELNLKTSQEGVALSPSVPQGKILIQVIAPGWKTFGEWFDVNQPEQTIRIHLLPIPKWY